MSTPLIYPPLQNGLQKTLDAQLLTGVTASATLNNVTGIQNLKGVMVIDRVDGNNNLTPNKREYVGFSGTSGSTVVTLTRGLAGSTDQDHAVGAIVEFVSDITQQQSIIDGLLNTITTAGALDTTKVVDLTTAQTLTNKILTAPSITSPSLTTWSTLNAPEGFLINGKIVPSVASNNLTVAIKGMDGNDPSASNPVYCRIGDTVRSITSALAVTKNAGTNWCNAGGTELATKEIDYFVYLGYNATDGVVVGFSRIPYATLYSDFSATSTNEKYAGISTITNAVAGDNYENVGRFAATLSAGAGYTWSVPTFTTANLVQKTITETRWSSWLPAIAWTAGVAPSSPNANYLMNRYRIRGQEIEIEFYRLYGSAGTTVTAGTITLPFGMNEDGMTDVFPAMACATQPLVASSAVGNSGTSPNTITFLCASSSLAQVFVKGGYKI